ncbi:MAG: ribonuclease Y, partial [Clostridiales bacterium]
MDAAIWAILAGVVCLGLGSGVGYLYRKNIAEKKIGRAEETVVRLIEDAQKKAEAIRKETVLEAKEEVHKLRSEFDKESKDRR